MREISFLLSNWLMQFAWKKPKRFFTFWCKKYAMKNPVGIYTCWPKSYSSADCAARRIHKIQLILVLIGQQSEGLLLQNKKWPLHSEKTPVLKNVAHPALVDKSEIYLPPLHNQHDLLRISVKATVKESEAFADLWQKFPKVSEVRIKEWIKFSPKITQILEDKNFSSKLNFTETRGWKKFEKGKQELSMQRESGKLQWNCLGVNFVIPCCGA